MVVSVGSFLSSCAEQHGKGGGKHRRFWFSVYALAGNSDHTVCGCLSVRICGSRPECQSHPQQGSSIRGENFSMEYPEAGASDHQEVYLYSGARRDPVYRTDCSHPRDRGISDDDKGALLWGLRICLSSMALCWKIYR